MTTTLTEQARRESGLGLAWATKQQHTVPNGPPNTVTPDPLADTVGFDAHGFLWGVLCVRCPVGVTCTYRLHFRWGGLPGVDDAWDEVDGSDKTVAAGRSSTLRIRVAGARRVYVEILTVSGGTVEVLWSNSTGEMA